MLDYLLFFAAVWGLCAGVAFSKLTAPVLAVIDGRGSFLTFVHTLLSCPMCLGFHVGYACVFFGLAPGPNTVMHALTIAFACAGINLLFALVVHKLGDQ